FRLMFAQFVEKHRCFPEKHAGIPVKPSGLEKALRRGEIGLFAEAANWRGFERSRRYSRRKLNVAVTGLRPSRHDPEHGDVAVVRRAIRRAHVAYKSLRLANHVIGRKHAQHRM